MDENQFWAVVWKLAAGVITTLIFVVGGCTAHTSYRISQAHDPVAAACALQNSERAASMACVAYAARAK